MSSQSISKCLQKFTSDTEAAVSDGETPLIELNTRKGPNTYYDPEKFNMFYLNYIVNKIKSASLTTDNDNQWQVQNAMNVLYLDGDWHFTDDVKWKNYDENCHLLANAYTSAWTTELEAHGYNISMKFIFLPVEFPAAKGGFHSFIYTDTEVSADVRRELYETVRRSFMDEFEDPWKSIIVEASGNTDINIVYNKVFDTGPLFTMQTLLPFAQKSMTSRNYILVDHDGFDADDPPDTLIVPVVPRETNSALIDDEEDIKSDITSLAPNIDNVDPLIDALLKENEDQRRSHTSKLGKVGSLTADFISRLIYLSNDHILWKQLADNTIKSRFIDTVCQFIYANHFIEKRGIRDITNTEFSTCLTAAILPLMRRTLSSEAEDTKRATWKSLMSHIKWFHTRIKQGNERREPIFNEEMIKFWPTYCTMSVKERKKMDGKQHELLEKIKKRFQQIIANWTQFVTEVIMNGLTDEIRPFDKVDHNTFDPANFNARNGMTFDKVLPLQPNVCKNIITIEESFYVTTIRSWTLMFMYVEYYNNKTLDEPIRAIISAFVRYYIWVQKEAGKNVIYIYNIHQTQMLTAFPYNQWIADPDGENLKSWIKTIYLQFIKPELKTINKCRRLMPFLANLSTAGIPINDPYGLNVKPLPNFSSDMKKVYENTLESFMQERYAPPRELSVTSSPFFPMRNGLLEFRTDGEPLFHTDNHDKFMNAYTNVTWDPNYDPTSDENRESFEAVTTMLEQIYPIESERVYALRLYASTLHGCGQRDQFIIQYGTGGDGKTTMNNLMNSMLGTDCLAESIQVVEHGKIVYIKNPRGLAGSMKTETVLVSKANGHDEGGIIQLKDKRFCSVQEPDPALSGGKLNCAKIKDMTGGTQVSGRHIFQANEAFVPNCLITLQTNFVPGFSEDSDATRRRLVIMPFRSKFHTKINSKRMKNLEYSFPASHRLNQEITTNPKYWQAFFYILLPYAKELIQSSFLPLSNIPQPDSIRSATNDAFSHSNGIVGWINKHIIKADGYVIQVSLLVNDIILSHNNSTKTTGGILCSKGQNAQRNEIYQQLGSTYTGAIYRLKDEYYTDGHHSIKDDYEHLELVPDQDTGNEEVVNKYFYRYSVENMERSYMIDKSDLYIVGYKQLTNDDEAQASIGSYSVSDTVKVISKKDLFNTQKESVYSLD